LFVSVLPGGVTADEFMAVMGAENIPVRKLEIGETMEL